MKTNKIIALILCLVLLVAFAAACNRDKDNNGDSSSDGQQSSDGEGNLPPLSDDPLDGTIEVWCWDPALSIYAMSEAARIYKDINPNFDINIVEVSWNELQTRLSTISSTGALDELPDLFLMQDNAFRKNVTSYPELFVDITGSDIDFSQFSEGKLSHSTINGRNFGVPFDAGTVVNALRTDVLEEANLRLSDFTDVTWDRYIELGKQVLAETGKAIYSDIHRDTDLLMIMLQSAGANLFNEDGSINIADNAELKQAIGIFVELVESGVCHMVDNRDDYIASFVSGEVAGVINGCWVLGTIQGATGQSGDWGITNLPKMNTPGATNYSDYGGSSWVLTSSSRYKELSLDFLENTFAGSVEFYEAILPSSGAVGAWLPAGRSAVYQEPHAFFGGQPIYANIADFTSKVPSNNSGVYYFEARDAVGAALARILDGADIDTELQSAHNQVSSSMG